MRQGRGGQRSKKSGCSRRGGNSGNSSNSPTVALATSLVDDGIGGTGASTAAVAAAAAVAASAAATASSWKPTGGDPFGIGYASSSVVPGNGVPYQQQAGHQSPSLFHQQQGSPIPGSSYGNGNNTPQHQQQHHYSPSTPGGGSSTPVPYTGAPGTPNSQHGGGQFNNVGGNGAQIPFGSPSSVSSGGGGSGFVNAPANSRPGSGPPQSSFVNQQFYGGSSTANIPSASPFSQQQQIMNHSNTTGGMINTVDNNSGGRMMVDHPSCFPSSIIGGRRSYGGYGSGMGGPSNNLGTNIHHSASTGHVQPGGSHHGLPSGNVLPHLHSHGSAGGPSSHIPSHHPHTHHSGSHGPPPHPHPSHAHHVQPDYRIFELNKRLQNRNEDSDNVWWDQFATEFFEDDATLTLTFCLEDGPKRYSIGRTLIPRYFRSIFEGGVTDLYYHLRANATKESFHNTSLTLDCDHCTMITTHFTLNTGAPSITQSPGSVSGIIPTSLNGAIGLQKSLVTQGPPSQQSVLGSGVGGPSSSPVFTRVCTEGRLTLEFTYDDMMRIRTWHLAVRQHKELVLRSTAAAAVAAIVVLQQGGPSEGVPTPPNAEIVHQQVAKNITRQGITNSTLNYLRLCVILEPMQELMSRHKAYALSPRDCLKTTLFQKWQRMIAPPESQRPANKRRKRKGSNSGSGPPNTPGTGGTGGGPTAASKKRSPGPNSTGIGASNAGFNLVSQDVMVVGEPSLMGGEFGDEDERLITRLENTQYDAAAAAAVNSVAASVMGIPGAPGSVSTVGGNDNIPHITSGPVSSGNGSIVPIGSGGMMSGEPLFTPSGAENSAPGTPTGGSGSISQSNSNLQQQQNSWPSGPSNVGGPSSNTVQNNQQQGSNPGTGGTSVNDRIGNPGSNGPPCNSNNVNDTVSSGGDKKSPASSCVQQH